MARLELVYTAILAIILAISTQQAFAIKCWACNSISFPFCRDPFDSKNLTENERFFNYIDCPANRCIKSVTNITLTNNQVQTRLESITRSCAVSPESAEQFCKSGGFRFCETCSTDGCNGATRFDSITIMAAIPVLITKLIQNYSS